MNIVELVNNYNFHDSILENVTYNLNDRIIQMEIELCNWKQCNFVAGNSEMFKRRILFVNVSSFRTEPFDYKVNHDDILNAELCCDGKLKMVTINDLGINIFNIGASSVEIYIIQYYIAKRDGNKANEHEDVKARNLPTKGTAYGSKDLYVFDKLETRRQYNAEGDVELDIHYSNHGNAKTHLKVPHRHDWTWNGDTPSKGEGY